MVNNKQETVLIVGGDVVSTSMLMGKIGKKEAAENFINELRQNNWVLIKKHANDMKHESITKEEIFGSQNKINEAIPDSNVGNKLLKLMGWSGGGVGAEGRKGIAEPVSVEAVINRSGLGLTSKTGIAKNFKQQMKKVLDDFLLDENQKDLFFSPEFLKEERALVHKMAQSMGLKTQSFDKSPTERYLTVMKKKNRSELVKEIALQGGETDRYKLVPPGQYNAVRAMICEETDVDISSESQHSDCSQSQSQ